MPANTSARISAEASTRDPARTAANANAGNANAGNANANANAGNVIADDAEALAVAAALADGFRAGASRRDSERALPYAELDRLSASGLLAVTVPAEHVGADVRQETLAEIFRLLASGTPPPRHGLL